MFELDRFVSDCLAARDAPDHLAVLDEVLGQAIGDPHGVRAAFAGDDDEESLIFRDHHLTVIHVRISPNVIFPPHNHHMDALIGVYEGREVHRHYVVAAGRLTAVGETGVAAGEIARCGVRDIHSVANGGIERSAALHIYCGDLVGMRRQIWSPATSQPMAYCDETYFALSRPFDAARPFTRPATCRAHAAGQLSAAAKP